MAAEGSTDTVARPYRSHKIPACSICRRRKIACVLDIPAAPCRFCRTKGLSCQAAASKHRSGVSRPSRKRKRPSSAYDAGAARPIRREDDADTATETLTAHFTSPEESATMLMNPPMAEDLNVLDQYLTSDASASGTLSEPYVRVSSTAKDDSIVYLSLPRQRKGLQATVDPGRAQREIIEQVLGEHKVGLLDLYFRKIHPCLPIVDRDSFWLMWHKDPARISSPLLCQMYAASLVFWRCSEILGRSSQPDMAFVWNMSVTALRDDLLAPCMTTVHASLLAITGRPTIGVTGNVVYSGSMITLAHSLALHRDPASWKIPQAEKRIRINVWWSVVIHDYWSSIAHGTPPNIRQENYDVPLPAVDLGSDGTSTSFRHLCSISAILGDTLPLIYSLRMDPKEAERRIRRLDCSLDEWEDGLPSALKPPSTVIDGASNLWFCFLSIKLLLCRVAYKTVIRNADVLPEEKQYRLAILRDSATRLAEYVSGLDDQHLLEFWLPYAAYLLVSAATTLLRTAIESAQQEKIQCVRTLLGLTARLTAARDTLSWDIGDFCLQRCKPTIDRLAAVLGINPSEDAAVAAPNRPVTVDSPADGGNDEHPPFRLNADLLLPLDSLDYQFNLFDDLAGPWPMNV